MSNTALLVLGVLSCVVPIVVAFGRNPAAAAPAAMALVFVSLACFGQPLWFWSREVGGSGLPESVDSGSVFDSPATAPLVWAAVGAAIASLLLPKSPPSVAAGRSPLLSGGVLGTVRNTVVEARQTSPTVARAVVVAMIVMYAVWLVGQGPSVLRRFEYNRTDGNQFLLRAGYTSGIVLAVAGIFLGASSKSPAIRWVSYGMAFVWFVSLSAVGTRTAVVLPFVFMVLMLRKAFENGHFKPFPLVIAVLAGVAAVITFGVALAARQYPHGMLNYLALVDGVLNSDNLLVFLKRLVASVAASHPITELSAQNLVAPSYLIGNANPLPGTALPIEYERLWPWAWVPLSFVGSWYAAMGTLAQVLLFGAMAYTCAIGVHNLRAGRLRPVSMIPVGLALLMALLCIQYPSRMVFRIFSVAILVAIGTYLVRPVRPPDTLPVATRDQPPPEVAARR